MRRTLREDDHRRIVADAIATIEDLVKTSSAVAKSYAKAIFELAGERNQAEAIEAELEQVGARSRTRTASWPTVLSRPWITPAVKRKIAEDIGQRLELSKLGRDVLSLVAAHGRADHLRRDRHRLPRAARRRPGSRPRPRADRGRRSPRASARRCRPGSAARSTVGRS